MPRGGPSWKLNSFLDSLILELDRAQDTLALKGINRRLTYTVRDLSLELQLFPEFDGRDLKFSTAGPGDTGAAKIAFQLGSITDRQIRETTREPPSPDDVAIEVVPELDDQTKHELQKIGVSTVGDIERMQRSNVAIKRTADGDRGVDYTRLANIINRTKRRQQAPVVAKAVLHHAGDTPTLALEGANLATSASASDFPAATLNGTPVHVVTATANEVRLAVPPGLLHDGANTLRVVLDPYAVVTMDVHA
jgi:hypothetical protein